MLFHFPFGVDEPPFRPPDFCLVTFFWELLRFPVLLERPSSRARLSLLDGRGFNLAGSRTRTVTCFLIIVFFPTLLSTIRTIQIEVRPLCISRG